MIETDRLILREISFEDRDELFELHTDPEVQKYTGESVVQSLDQIDRAIRKRHRDYSQYGFGRLTTIKKDTHEFIGWSGLTYLPEFDKVDIGYRFKKKFWGQGFATEASKAILEYGFNTLNLDLIIAIALPENKASTRVMEKIGMEYEKLAPYDEGSPEAVWYKLERLVYNRK